MTPVARIARDRISRFSHPDQPLASGEGGFRLPRPPSRRVELARAPEAPVIPIDPEKARTAGFEGDFAKVRARLVLGIETSTSADRPLRQLEFARFLIARGMLPEARSVVEAVLAAPEPVPQPAVDLGRGYLAILAMLVGNGPTDLPEAWAGDPLWPVLAAQGPLDEDRLRGAARALGGQSREVATLVLPHLFDLALQNRQLDLAADVLAAAPAGTDLEGTGLLDLMQGQLALAQGDEDLGFDTLARVAEGEGAAAVRARLSLADLAAGRQDPDLLPHVSDLLQEAVPRWRGDDAALRLRVRLAQVAEEAGDIPTALETLAMILREHPQTDEAHQAEGRIAGLVRRVATDVADPEVPLETALAQTRRLEPVLYGRGDWVGVRVALAQRLAEAGLAAAARAEFADIARMQADALRQADPALVASLFLQHARLLIDRGDLVRARAVLDAAPRATGAAAAIAALRLGASATAILPSGLLAALQVRDIFDVQDPQVQLALAGIAVAAGEPEAALRGFDLGLSVADQSQRLTAIRVAAETGDAARIDRYAAGLAGDRADLQRPVIAGLAAPRRPRAPLSVGDASGLITAAAEAGQAVDALLSGRGDP